MQLFIAFLLIPYFMMGLAAGAMVTDPDVPFESWVLTGSAVLLAVWVPLAFWSRRLGRNGQFATGDLSQDARFAAAKELVRPFVFGAAGSYVFAAICYPTLRWTGPLFAKLRALIL